MPIYKIIAPANDPDEGPVDVSFQFCKLGQVIYDAHNRQVYVLAPNEKVAVKKGLKFIKQSLAEDLEMTDNITLNYPALHQYCVTCGKKLTYKEAIGYIPPHKSWVCWFYCEECYEDR